jgi:NitT/TauT family transport system permease protein
MSEAATRPVRFLARGFVTRPRPVAAALFGAGLLGLWQWASVDGLLDPIFMPPPSAVFDALDAMARSGELVRHLGASLTRIGAGWAIGTAAGLAIGSAMALLTLARAAGMPVVSALFPVPKIALLPLLILWFGIGEPAQIATIALGVFFPTAIAVYSAVDQVPRGLVRMAQSFGVPTRRILWKVVLPGALPGVLAGFRITSAIALILVVAAEMIGAQHGIGALVLTAGNLMQTDQLLAGVALLSILGLTLGALLSLAERILLRWR